MKKQRFQKLIACLLAVMMLLPLLCVPTVTWAAEAEAPTMLYTQDFSGITINQWYEVNKPTSDAIVDFPDSSNKVWQINLADHNGKNSAAKDFVYRYFDANTYTTMVYQFDVYVDAEAKGQIGMDSLTSGVGFRGIFAIDTTNERVIGNPTFNGAGNVVSVIGDTTVTKGAWHTIALVFDLVGGSYVLYVDGTAALDVQVKSAEGVAYTNMNLNSRNDGFIFAKASGGSGTVYYDNIKIYEPYESSEPSVSMLYTQDFSGITINQWYEMNKPTSDAIVDFPGSSNKVWQINLADHNDKNSAAKDFVYKYFDANTYTKMVYQFDVYVDAEAEGLIGMDSLTSGVGFRGIFAIDTTNERVIGNPTFNGAGNVVSVIGDTTVTKGAWHTIALVFDLVGGSYELYVDGAAALDVQVKSAEGVAYTNMNLNSRNDGFIFAKASGGSGTVYYDNFAIYEGSDENIDIVTVETMGIDESKTLQYIEVEIGDMVSRTFSTQYLVRADQTLTATPVYFNDNGKYDAIVSMPTEGSTSVRYGEPTGLRFKTIISEALVAELQAMVANGTLKAVEMGTLIAPENYLADGKTLKDLKAYTSEEYNALETKPAAGTYALKVAVDKYYEENTIVGSIVNIKEGNYTRDFAAAGYVKVTLLSGETVVIVAAEPTVDNVKDVAQRVIDSGYNGVHLDTLVGFGATVAE